ncbi:MAG: hypothetical protein Q4B77_05920 [Coriobacteriaceae bacterium]|nr:hypothetical protein [Coriobacteriaceae bacterium]
MRLLLKSLDCIEGACGSFGVIGFGLMRANVPDELALPLQLRDLGFKLMVKVLEKIFSAGRGSVRARWMPSALRAFGVKVVKHAPDVFK